MQRIGPAYAVAAALCVGTAGVITAANYAAYGLDDGCGPGMSAALFVGLLAVELALLVWVLWPAPIYPAIRVVTVAACLLATFILALAGVVALLDRGGCFS
jgi:hypothetical protein